MCPLRDLNTQVTRGVMAKTLPLVLYHGNALIAVAVRLPVAEH